MQTVASCIFCKIIARQIPATIMAETNRVIVIKDINPQADVHYLIIPKEHVQDIQSMTQEHLQLLAEMGAEAQKLSAAAQQDFKLVVNSGREVGQEVLHLHMHYLAGRLHK